MSTPANSPISYQANKGIRLFILCVVIAFLMTGYRYLTPLSGITGAGGALLTLVGELVLIACGVAVMLNHHASWRTVTLVLIWIGTVLCLIAELFLHGWTSAMLLIVSVVGLIYFGLTVSQKRSS